LTNKNPKPNSNVAEDFISNLYKKLVLTPPDRTPSSDYVESYNAPLGILPSQHGLIAYDFNERRSAIVQIPKGVAQDLIIVKIFLKPIHSGAANSLMEIIGGKTFKITAVNSKNKLIHNFSQPLKITLSVQENLVGEKDLGVYWFDTIKKEWINS
jgi:hypothetical protein